MAAKKSKRNDEDDEDVLGTLRSEIYQLRHRVLELEGRVQSLLVTEDDVSGESDDEEEDHPLRWVITRPEKPIKRRGPYPKWYHCNDEEGSPLWTPYVEQAFVFGVKAMAESFMEYMEELSNGSWGPLKVEKWS